MSQSAASNGVQRPTQLWAEARERDLSPQWLPGTHHLLSQHPVALPAVVTEKGGAHPGRAFVGDTGEGSHHMQLPVANYATALRMCHWDVQLGCATGESFTEWNELVGRNDQRKLVHLKSSLRDTAMAFY